MPDLKVILQLRDFQIVRITILRIIEVLAIYGGPRPSFCPHCEKKSYFHLKDHVERTFLQTTVNRRVVKVRASIRKWKCLLCKRTSSDRLDGVLPSKRASEIFRRQVFTEHEQGISKKALSLSKRVSEGTIENWYQDHLKYRMKELSGRECPRILGIDEHFFTRKQGYATTLVDLKNHKVFDVTLGRSELSLGAYLKNLKGREKVKVVVMDLSETYRSIAKKYFPNAMIVTDRFHVIRLINHHFLRLWRELDPERSKNRGLLSLIRRNRENLTPDQGIRLDQYLEQSPAIREIYWFKADLIRLMKIKGINNSRAKQLIPELLARIAEMKNTPFLQMQILRETIERWIEPIVRMWRFTKTNSTTEGFHNKMELISRRAYGFRNFKNYRLRVIALCGWDGVLAVRS